MLGVWLILVRVSALTKLLPPDQVTFVTQAGLRINFLRLKLPALLSAVIPSTLLGLAIFLEFLEAALKRQILLLKALDHYLLGISIVHGDVFDVIGFLSIVKSLHSLVVVLVTGGDTGYH